MANVIDTPLWWHGEQPPFAITSPEDVLRYLKLEIENQWHSELLAGMVPDDSSKSREWLHQVISRIPELNDKRVVKTAADVLDNALTALATMGMKNCPPRPTATDNRRDAHNRLIDLTLLLERRLAEPKTKEEPALVEKRNGEIVATPLGRAHGLLLGQFILGPTPMHGNRFPVSDFDCITIPGETPSICPNADRKPQVEWLPQIERLFRECGAVGQGQTVHWVGSQSKAGYVCGCFRKTNGAAKLKQTAAGMADTEPGVDAPLAPADLARMFRITNVQALTKRLERWRSNNHGGWKEVRDPKPREPKYLYQLSAVRAILEKMASDETSGERRAK